MAYTGWSEGMGWESRAVAAALASRRKMSGETRWDGCTDDRRPPFNDRITLHGDDTRCVRPCQCHSLTVNR